MPSLEILFWSCLCLGLYPYLGYPVLAWALGRLAPRPVARADGHTPPVTLIIAAYNEARHIEATLRNKLAQQYPADRLQVLVVSDGSTDGTDEIVAAIAAGDHRVRLIRQSPRQGKTAALNRAVAEARGEILVFSDANSMYQAGALATLVANFADPRVGYVTGHMLYTNEDGSLVGDGCSAYMKYENFLRATETRLGSVVGVDGAIDAVRRGLYRPMGADQLPDFVLPLDVVEQGYRVVYAPGAVVTEAALSSDTQEYRMRVRVALRALWALWDKRRLLNPLRYPLFSWQLWSHKVLRYGSFLPLGIAIACNWLLLGSGPVYGWAAAGQVVFAALTAARFSGIGPLASSMPTRYCYYFALLNWSSAVAAGRFVRGSKSVLWQPRVG